MGYDAVGNTETKADAALALTKRMTYDSQNRIQRVENDTTHEVMGEYRYDDQGFRVYKKHKQANAATTTTPASTTIYELETPNKYFAVERQKDLANNPVPNTEYAVNNIFLDGVRIAAMVPTGQARWFMTDQVDSVNVVTNDNGDAISAIDYLPYGETWYQEGDTGFSPKYNSQEHRRRRLAKPRHDKESGLYFFNARHYDPETARFETADSVVDGEYSVVGWNRYTYVHGNPIMYKDPTGHQSAGAPLDFLDSAMKSFTGGGDSRPAAAADGGTARASVENKLQSTRSSSGNISPAGNVSGKAIITGPYPNYTKFYKNKPHAGIDLASDEGGTIRNVSRSEVVDLIEGEEGVKGKSSRVVLRNLDTGDIETYKHTSPNPSLKKGDKLDPGTDIGNTDMTGDTTAPHLHFEVKNAKGKPVEPVQYLKRQQPGLKFEIAKNKYESAVRAVFKKRNPEALRIIDQK